MNRGQQKVPFPRSRLSRFYRHYLQRCSESPILDSSRLRQPVVRKVCETDVRPNPQASISCSQQTRDLTWRQLFPVRSPPRHKSHTIKPEESSVGSQPNVTVSSLRNVPGHAPEMFSRPCGRTGRYANRRSQQNPRLRGTESKSEEQISVRATPLFHCSAGDTTGFTRSTDLAAGITSLRMRALEHIGEPLTRGCELGTMHGRESER